MLIHDRGRGKRHDQGQQTNEQAALQLKYLFYLTPVGIAHINQGCAKLTAVHYLPNQGLIKLRLCDLACDNP